MATFPPHQRLKVLDRQGNRLVYFAEAPSTTYWDSEWAERDPENFRRRVERDGHPLWARWLAHRHLRDRHGRILEGGCGLASHVLRLHRAGYRVTGIDNALATVAKVNETFPELDVQAGDVRSLPFRDASFQLYLSFGVFEHFRAGPEPALAEARRVLAPGGSLILTVPYFSPLRRVRAKFGSYRVDDQRGEFFQYAYRREWWCETLRGAGFRVRGTRPLSGFFGLWEDAPALAAALDPIGRATSPLARMARAMLGPVVAPLSGHMLAMWAQRI